MLPFVCFKVQKRLCLALGCGNSSAVQFLIFMDQNCSQIDFDGKRRKIVHVGTQLFVETGLKWWF